MAKHAYLKPTNCHRSSARKRRRIESESNEEGPQPIDSLPPELLAYILEHLSLVERVQAEKVSRLWKSVGFNKAWVNVKRLSFDVQVSTKHSLNSLAQFGSIIQRCGRFLVELRLKGFHGRLKFAHLFKLMPNLEHLHFDSTRLDQTIIPEIAKHMSKLRSLSLGPPIGASSVQDLMTVFDKCASLRFLRFPINIHLEPPERFSENLRLLHVTVGAAYSVYADNDFKRFRIEQVVQRAVFSCPRLNFLMLPIYSSVTAPTIEHIISLRSLKYLRINYPPTLQTSFLRLLNFFPDMQALLLDIISEKVLNAIVQQCPSLVHLSFLWEPNRRSSPALMQLTRLTKLRSFSIGFIRKVRAKSAFAPDLVEAFESLISKGTLEHFHCSEDFALPFGLVYSLFKQCKRLSTIGCALQPDALERINEILSLLDERYVNELPLPRDKANDPRVLQIYLNTTAKKFAQLPHHPWVNYKLIIWREDIGARMLQEFCMKWLGNSVPKLVSLDE